MNRRRFVNGGVAALGLALAGCTSQTASNDDETEPNETEDDGSTETETESGNETEAETETEDDGAESSYAVSIEPMGEVTFDAVPETWVADNGSWGDMGVALGVGAPSGVWMPSRYTTRHYDELPGVSVDTDITKLYSSGVDKELFIDIDADVHVMDPNFAKNRLGLDDGDIEDIRAIGPFFGNTIFSRAYPWHEDYRYYTLYEAFEKLAQVFQREERFEAFSALHDEVVGDVRDRVPDGEGPSVAVLWPTAEEPEGFYPYIVNEGTSYKHWRDLNVTDALADNDAGDFHDTRNEVDYETLVEVDPDVLLLQGNENMTEDEFRDQFLGYMRDHSVASSLQAVQDGNVFQGGSLYQGPITNLFLTERGAKQLYPDEFTEDELFDRQRVADIVNGEF